MKIVSASALAALLLTCGAASAGVNVTYQAPERFSDVPFGEIERTRLLKSVSAHFETLARRLPAGQQLTIEVSDIDLAGRIDPMRRGLNDIRVMRGGADWPRMHLRYRLEANGAALREGEADLSDMSYLQTINPYASGDPLRYEKRMIDQWFERQILHAGS